MADMHSLADLRDIHLPTPISAWPPGPGYYALMALSVMLLLLFLKHQHHRRSTAPKREALLELTRLETAYQDHMKTQIVAAEITHLLKRVALVYHPRLDVASLHGESWLIFLNQTSKNLDFDPVRTSLIETPFNPQTQADLTPLFAVVRLWIKQRSKRCSN